VESLIWQEICPQRHVLPLQVLMQHGNYADGEVPAIPPAIWKNPSGVLAVVAVYHSASSIMYSIPVRTVCIFLHPARYSDRVHVAQRGIFQPGTNMGRFFSAAASSQLS